jgi:hypothetical protein
MNNEKSRMEIFFRFTVTLHPSAWNFFQGYEKQKIASSKKMPCYFPSISVRPNIHASNNVHIYLHERGVFSLQWKAY